MIFGIIDIHEIKLMSEKTGKSELSRDNIIKNENKTERDDIMTKVKLPKEVAEAIENLRDFGFTDYGIIVESENATRNGNGIEELRTIRKFTFESEGDGAQHFLQALVNGYEVEKTPEDKLREYYDGLIRAEDREVFYGRSGSQFRQGWVAVEETLSILGITIEGINE